MRVRYFFLFPLLIAGCAEKPGTTLTPSGTPDFDDRLTAIHDEWMGTPWDFSGTSQVPRKGSIACGYFVSTVGLDEEKIRQYIRDQEKNDRRVDQLKLF